MSSAEEQMFASPVSIDTKLTALVRVAKLGLDEADPRARSAQDAADQALAFIVEYSIAHLISGTLRTK